MTTLVATAVALTACGMFQQPPKSDSPTLQEISQTGSTVVASSLPTAGATTFDPSAALVVNFSSPMDRALVEKGFVLMEGSLGNSQTTPALQNLTLTSICNGRWRVRNPNSVNLVYTWDVYGKTEKGSGIAAAKTDVFFSSSVGANTVRIFVNGKQVNVKATNPALCSGATNEKVPGAVAGTFSWNDQSTQVSFKPSQPLKEKTAHFLNLGLAQPYTVSFQTGEASPISTGVLQPGGTFVGVDGVSVKVPLTTASNEPFNVIVERVEPTRYPGPWSFLGLKFVTAQYKIKAEYLVGSDDNFLISIPSQGTYDPSKRYASWAYESSWNTPALRDMEEKFGWEPFGELKYDAASASFQIPVGFLDDKDFVIVVVELPIAGGTTQPQSSFETTNVPNFNVICDYPNIAVCSRATIDDAKRRVTSAYIKLTDDLDFSRQFRVSPVVRLFPQLSLFPQDVRGSFSGRCANDDRFSIVGSYSPSEQIITLCIRANGEYVASETQIDDTVRHELFHAAQAAYIDSADGWFSEGTAEAIVRSTKTSMSAVNATAPFPLRNTLLIVNRNPARYSAQDFWVYLGLRMNLGPNYLERFLLAGQSNRRSLTTNGISTTIRSFPYPGGGNLPTAYWDWA